MQITWLFLLYSTREVEVLHADQLVFFVVLYLAGGGTSCRSSGLCCTLSRGRSSFDHPVFFVVPYPGGGLHAITWSSLLYSIQGLGLHVDHLVFFDVLYQGGGGTSYRSPCLLYCTLPGGRYFMQITRALVYDLNFICPGPEITWYLVEKVRKPGQNKKFSKNHG